MGKQLVRFDLEDDSYVIFETTETAGQAGAVDQRVANRRGGELDVESSSDHFEKVAARIRPAAQVVLNALKDLNTPKEIQLEFGVKFSAKAGVIIASADSEMHFKVTVKWENK